MKQHGLFVALAFCSLAGSLAGCKCSSVESTASACSDSTDNDGDGLVDCADPDCKAVTVCTGGTGGGSGTGGAGGSGGRGGGAGSSNVDGGDGTTHNPTGPGSGGPGFQLDGGGNSQGTGVKLEPDAGYIVLNSGSSEFYFMWIANDAQGWVSKYDTRTGREVGRYYSSIPKDCAGSAGPPCANGGGQPALRYNQGNHPSRTAIDIYGDVWVANRAIGVQGSVTKIANDLSSCIDRDNNGRIKTSRDIDGDGQISTTLCVAGECEMIVPANPADPLDYDECVLFSTPVGAVGGDVAERGIAISKGLEGTAGDVWVANFREQRVYKLSSANGQIIPVNAAGDTFITLTFGPYGMIVDGQQRLWVVEPGVARVAIINTLDGSIIAPSVTPPAGTTCSAYALGIDGKDRLWLPGWSAGAIACRYDRATDTWTRFDFTGTQCVGGMNQAIGNGRGIAADDQGNVYMSAYNGRAQLIRFNADTGAVIPFGTAGCIDATDAQTSNSIGVGLDGDGHPWVNNYTGNAMKIDKVTGAVTRTPQQPAGLYTYSDFTGYQLRKFTAPRGTYRKDFEGCSDMTGWRTLNWDADVPTGTTLQVFVKVAATRAELDNTAVMRYGPYTSSPIDLAALMIPKARWIRVEFVLQSNNGASTPVLKGFDLNWSCVIEPM